MRTFVRDLSIHMPVCKTSGISIFDNMVAVAVAIVIAIVIAKVTPTRTQRFIEREREREREIDISYICVVCCERGMAFSNLLFDKVRSVIKNNLLRG